MRVHVSFVHSIATKKWNQILKDDVCFFNLLREAQSSLSPQISIKISSYFLYMRAIPGIAFYFSVHELTVDSYISENQFKQIAVTAD